MVEGNTEFYRLPMMEHNQLDNPLPFKQSFYGLYYIGPYTYQHVPYVVAIVDGTHVGSATASFKVMVTVAQGYFTN